MLIALSSFFAFMFFNALQGLCSCPPETRITGVIAVFFGGPFLTGVYLAFGGRFLPIIVRLIFGLLSIACIVGSYNAVAQFTGLHDTFGSVARAYNQLITILAVVSLGPQIAGWLYPVRRENDV